MNTLPGQASPQGFACSTVFRPPVPSGLLAPASVLRTPRRRARDTDMRVPKPLTTEQARLIEQAESLMRSRVRTDGKQLSDPSTAGSMFR